MYVLDVKQKDTLANNLILNPMKITCIDMEESITLEIEEILPILLHEKTVVQFMEIFEGDYIYHLTKDNKLFVLVKESYEI